MKERKEQPSSRIAGPTHPFGKKTQTRPTKRRRPSPSIPGQQGGTQSGRVRSARSDFRRRIIAMVHEQLKPTYQSQPFSTEALNALRDEYLKVLNGEQDNVFRRMLYALPQSPSPELDALVQSMRPPSSQQIITKPRSALKRPAVAPDKNKVLMHLVLEKDISNLSDTDHQFLKQVSHDTLLKDLKGLGIRSKRRKNLLQKRKNPPSNNQLRRAMFLLIHHRIATHLVQAEEAGNKLMDEERRIRFLRTAECYRDQYLKLLYPKLNKPLRAQYMKLIDQIQDGEDEMRRQFKWTMRALDQLSAAGRKVMSEISCETFFKDLEDVGLIVRVK